MELSNKNLKWIIIGLLGFVAAVVIFGLGIFIGGMKARFSYKWADNYHKNFAGPKGGFSESWRGRMPLPRDFISGHGVFGEIIKIESPAGDSNFAIKGKDEVEKAIVVTDKTLIENRRVKIKREDLKVGDFITVIGSPDEEGKIEAKMIRVF